MRPRGAGTTPVRRARGSAFPTAVLYARVSTRKQEACLWNQVARLEAWARARNLPNDGLAEGASGVNEGRAAATVQARSCSSSLLVVAPLLRWRTRAGVRPRCLWRSIAARSGQRATAPETPGRRADVAGGARGSPPWSDVREMPGTGGIP